MKYVLARYRNKAHGFRGYLWSGIIFDGRAQPAIDAAIRYTKEEAEAKVAEFATTSDEPTFIVPENEI